MEFTLLAQTSKILYDKDYLDNMKKVEDLKRHPIIKFDSLYDYFDKVTIFQVNIKQHIQRLVLDTPIFEIKIDNIEWLNDEVVFIKHLQKIIKKELMKLTNHTETKRCGETSVMIVNSIKGALKGLQMCGNPTQNSVRDMIICIVFSMCSTNDNYSPILDKISYLKWFQCKKVSHKEVEFGAFICENCTKQVRP